MIRRGTVSDIAAIVTLGVDFLHESYAGRLAENPAQMANLIERLMTGGDDSIVFVAERDARLVGMIGMIAHTHFISGERVAGEVFWYVAPTARGSAGIRLLRAAEQWARARGARVLQMIAPDGADRVATVYKTLGFAPVETTWQRVLA